MSNYAIEMLEKCAVTEYRKNQLELAKVARCRDMVRRENLNDSEMAKLRNKFETMAKQMKYSA